MARALNPGWVRFPGGISADAYNWQTGQEDPNWVQQVYVAGQAMTPVYAGAQGEYAGLDQVNISLPGALAGTGEASVYLVADGATSNMVTINIQ